MANNGKCPVCGREMEKGRCDTSYRFCPMWFDQEHEDHRRNLIERLRHPINGMRPTRTDGRAAANALSAAQARIAELEAEPQPMRCAECNCENGGDDCNWIRSANERPKTSNADAWQLFLSECGFGHPYIAAQIAEAIDAAHERGRLQGLDEAADIADEFQERIGDEIRALKTEGGEW